MTRPGDCLTSTLLDELHRTPAIPRVTAYDDSTGARIELAAPTLGNWAAKYANYITDELMLAGSGRIAIVAELGWQLPGLLLGAWWAGCSVTLVSLEDAAADSLAEQDLIIGVPQQLDAIEARAGVAEIALASTDVFGRSLAAIGEEVPLGMADLAAEVQIQPDAFTRPHPTDPTVPLLGEITSADLQAAASALVAELGAQPRLLTQAHLLDATAVAEELIAPLLAGGSVVHISPAPSPQRWEALAATERAVTR